MPTYRPALLTPAQREQFTRFPDLDERLLARHYLLSEDDLRLVQERRRDFNRLGYAVQLTVLKHLGRGLEQGEAPPQAVLAFLGEQLQVDPGCYGRYAAREPTRREHLGELCALFDYRPFSLALNQQLRQWLIPRAVITDQPFGLMTELLDELRRRKLLLPRITVLERIVASARTRADEFTYNLLNLPLKGEDQGRVDALLVPQGERPISDFAALGRPVGQPKARNLLKLLDRLIFVRSFPVQSNLREFLPRSRLDHLAEEGRRLTAQHLAQYEPRAAAGHRHGPPVRTVRNADGRGAGHARPADGVVPA